LGRDGGAVNDGFAPYAAEASAEPNYLVLCVEAKVTLRGKKRGEDALAEGLVRLGAARSSRFGFGEAGAGGDACQQAHAEGEGATLRV
jgi:hypothetical protein